MTQLNYKNMDEHPVWGLLPTKADPRDFSTQKVFGAVPLDQLPAEFEIPLKFPIQDQGPTDMCAAYAGVKLSEHQEGIKLSEDFQFAMARYRGNWTGFGCDLRSIGKSLTRDGSLPKDQAPFTWRDRGRNFVADYHNWPEACKAAAWPQRKASFFKVDGPYDLFDNFRSALYSNRDLILTGALWSNDWTRAQNGLIPESYIKGTGGHGIGVCGWVEIKGQPYLKIFNSYGTKYGDGGFYYMSRKVANRELSYGQGFMVTDISPEDAKNASWGALTYLYNILIKILEGKLADLLKKN